MIVLCLAGSDVDARDALATALIKSLRARDIAVSVIARAPADAPLDTPAKDTHAHSQAGARAVLAISPARWAIMRREETPPTLADLCARLQPGSVVFALGYDEAPYPTLAVEQGGLTLSRPKMEPPPRFDLDNPGSIIDFILLPHNPDR